MEAIEHQHWCEQCGRRLPSEQFYAETRSTWAACFPDGAEKDYETFYRCRDKTACDVEAKRVWEQEDKGEME